MSFLEPEQPFADRTQVLLGYLDLFRERSIARVGSMPDPFASSLPSGWSPAELLQHLTFVELRWLEWGFLGAPVDDPWGDEDGGRWRVAAGTTLDQLVQRARSRGEGTREIAEAHPLDRLGEPGPRWETPATLERVLLHLVQEYARHLGQLDVVAELGGGSTGE